MTLAALERLRAFVADELECREYSFAGGDPDSKEQSYIADAREALADVEALIAAFPKAKADLAAAREDSARLDFLDRLNAALNKRTNTTYRWQLIFNHNITRLMLGGLLVDLNDVKHNGLASCRDAIDAKRREPNRG